MPQLSSSTPTSEEPELLSWSIAQSPITFLDSTTADVRLEHGSQASQTSMVSLDTTTADVLPEQESQADTDSVRSLIQVDFPRVINRRSRKRKDRSEAEIKAARDSFLLRNRGAASKCRARKKGWIRELEDKARIGKLKNDKLQLERDELMEEVQILKNLVALCQAREI